MPTTARLPPQVFSARGETESGDLSMTELPKRQLAAKLPVGRPSGSITSKVSQTALQSARAPLESRAVVTKSELTALTKVRAGYNST